jgi:uncharacterized phage protein (TIGR01671 family)
MRDIKFRAWDNIGEQMIFDFGMTPEDYHAYIIPEGAEYPDQFEYYDDIKLMQYTGLKDKNGVEIYEGDILRLFDPRLPEKTKSSEVTFDRGAFLVDTQMGTLPDRTTLKTLYRELMNREYSDCEVIGNIYENPELINDRKD